MPSITDNQRHPGQVTSTGMTRFDKSPIPPPRRENSIKPMTPKVYLSKRPPSITPNKNMDLSPIGKSESNNKYTSQDKLKSKQKTSNHESSVKLMKELSIHKSGLSFIAGHSAEKLQRKPSVPKLTTLGLIVKPAKDQTEPGFSTQRKPPLPTFSFLGKERSRSNSKTAVREQARKPAVPKFTELIKKKGSS